RWRSRNGWSVSDQATSRSRSPLRASGSESVVQKCWTLRQTAYVDPGAAVGLTAPAPGDRAARGREAGVGAGAAGGGAVFSPDSTRRRASAIRCCRRSAADRFSLASPKPVIDVHPTPNRRGGTPGRLPGTGLRSHVQSEVQGGDRVRQRTHGEEVHATPRVVGGHVRSEAPAGLQPRAGRDLVAALHGDLGLPHREVV